MKNTSLLTWDTDKDSSAKLYEFLATDFSIKNLAYKIAATQNSKLNKMSLRKISENVA